MEFDGSVRVLRIPPTGRGRWRKWLLPATAFVSMLRERRRYDLVLVAGFRILGIPALLVRLITGRPTILKADSRGELSGEYFRAGLARLGLRPDSWPVRPCLAVRNALLRRADAWVALSREAAGELLDHAIEPGRTHVIGNGVDTERFSPATPDEQNALRDRLNLPRDRHIVVYTGRLVSYKGLPVLLDAWTRLRERQPQAILVLVGEGGADIHACEHTLRERAMTTQLKGSVHFAGSVDNVHDWLRAADVFAFPTEEEAFGLSLAEAMACGLPAVTTAVGGLADFIEDRVNSLVVPAGDRASLAEALDTLLRSDSLRRELGRAARSTVMRRFSIDAVTDAYVSLFEQLAHSATSAHGRP